MSKQTDEHNLAGLSMTIHDAAKSMIECDRALAAAGALDDADIRTYYEAREHAVALIGATTAAYIGSRS